MKLKVIRENDFNYVDEGQGEVLVLLHGLFGALSNWEEVTGHFSKKYRVLIPMMPIYDLPVKKASLDSLVSFLESFVAHKELDNMTLIGNSLGGHVALMYILQNQNKVQRLVLTGSSGMFENTMGATFPKRGSYEFVQEKVAYTFYDPKLATKELVDEVFNVTTDIPKCLRMVGFARSAQKHNMSKELHKIKVPTLLIWGLNDTITPPLVAHEFDRLIPDTELRFIDRCGHAPMMEHPAIFNQLFENFLEKHRVLI